MTVGVALSTLRVRLVGGSNAGVGVGVGVGVGAAAVTVTLAVTLFAVWFDGLILLNVMTLVPCVMPWKVKFCDPGTPTR